MDVAERFKTAEQVHAGQVVIFDEPAEAVRLCDRAYDSRVVGIASAEPAFILGLDPEQMPIALCGRVPCYVDADIAPIAVGDLLTTSPTRGHAQKVLQPDKALGAIIGKALGRLDAGQGKIPVMVLLHEDEIGIDYNRLTAILLEAIKKLKEAHEWLTKRFDLFE